MYTKSLEIEEIANRILAESKDPRIQLTAEARPKIAYRECDKAKRSRGMTVQADCEKVKKSNKQYMDYDYIITVYTPSCKGMSPEQLETLILHELLHINCIVGDDGEMKCYIRPHDVQDFRSIIDEKGIDWSVME